jgi:hypothetical protein
MLQELLAEFKVVRLIGRIPDHFIFREQKKKNSTDCVATINVTFELIKLASIAIR